MKVTRENKAEIKALCDKYDGLGDSDVSRIIDYCEKSRHNYLNLDAVALKFADDNYVADEDGSTRLTELSGRDSIDGQPHEF